MRDDRVRTYAHAIAAKCALHSRRSRRRDLPGFGGYRRSKPESPA